MQDYTQSQVDAWTWKPIDLDRWNKMLANTYPVVSEENGVITGYGNIDDIGYLDHLYIHKDFQRMGTVQGLEAREVETANEKLVNFVMRKELKS